MNGQCKEIVNNNKVQMHRSFTFYESNMTNEYLHCTSDESGCVRSVIAGWPPTSLRDHSQENIVLMIIPRCK